MEDRGLRHRCLRRAPRFALFALVALAASGFVAMSLWNWLMPGIFGLARIGFWQALGLLLLSRVLFGSFRHGPGCRHHWHWRQRLLARWEQMTPEEREKLREGLKGCQA